MASKKNLKKEIKYLVNDLITECEVYREFHPKADRDKIQQIIESLVEKEKSIVKNINQQVPEMSSSEQKVHYQNLYQGARDELIAILDELPKAGK